MLFLAQEGETKRFPIKKKTLSLCNSARQASQGVVGVPQKSASGL